MTTNHHPLTLKQTCAVSQSVRATQVSMTEQFDRELEAMRIKYRNVPELVVLLNHIHHARHHCHD